MTASILKCIKLALHIENKFSDIKLDVTTSSELTICDVEEVIFFVNLTNKKKKINSFVIFWKRMKKMKKLKQKCDQLFI